MLTIDITGKREEGGREGTVWTAAGEFYLKVIESAEMAASAQSQSHWSEISSRLFSFSLFFFF